MMRDFRNTVRCLKTILKLEDMLEEHKPYLLKFRVLLTCCVPEAGQIRLQIHKAFLLFLIYYHLFFYIDNLVLKGKFL